MVGLFLIFMNLFPPNFGIFYLFFNFFLSFAIWVFLPLSIFGSNFCNIQRTCFVCFFGHEFLETYVKFYHFQPVDCVWVYMNENCELVYICA
jgi:hypothetical protein